MRELRTDKEIALRIADALDRLVIAQLFAAPAGRASTLALWKTLVNDSLAALGREERVKE